MLAGNLTDFSLEDIFQLFALTKKSGALRLETDTGEGRVHFVGGEVYFAVVDVRRLALGARLVGAGHLSEETLRRLGSERRECGAVEIVGALLGSDEVEPAAMQEYLRDQIVDSVSTLMRLEEARFTFDNTLVHEEWTGPRLTTGELLEEGRRRLREWQVVTTHVPALDVPLVLVPSLPGEHKEVTLSRAQWQVLSLVDGRRSVIDLVDLTGTGEFATGKLVAELVAAGLIEARSSVGRTAMDELLAGRDALRRLERLALGAGAPADRDTDGAAPDGFAASSTAPTVEGENTSSESPSAVATPVQPAGRPAQPEGGGEPAHEQTPQDGDSTGGPHGHVAGPPTPEPDPQTPLPQTSHRPQVDRAQMARELASLGFGDLGSRRGGNRG